MKERRSYTQQNIALNDEDYKEIDALRNVGWKVVDILREGIKIAKTLPPKN